ncbi:MAG TPA: efflux RND transporter permease subunit, partial [Polyangiaceae bacterium LLY-WYZ-15_(1-7)]|nr:efflux RND transporter permease subunit [Polyangiaceae bacterium LLY-WYZ-15_(1-7)]
RARAAELGVSVAAVAETLGTLVGGRDVTDLQLGTEQYDVRVQATEVARARGELERFTVRASSGRLVPLAQVTRLREGVGPTAIERMSRQRSVTVYATTLPGASTATILQRLEEATVELAMPADYSTDLAGRAKEFGRTAKAFGVAILLSFIFMYLVIAAQFESWLHPVTILATLPMTVPFAMISLLIFGQSLNLFAMLGVLVLFGIVKKNAILQIDHMLHLMKEGWSRPDAIMLANRDRLRPILMTTLAFVAGMAPLMISTGAGSGTNHAIAGIVLGGQSLALGLTLLATPVLFTWLDDLQALTHRAFEKVRHRFVDVKEPAATDA